ncbi:Transcription factor IIIB 90 kDa subunit [Morella rubra]|uniref:Transcription factor IIIB 90 kDa subunit n=1 Tax=Morella rubra TaxID=262757 RepID=A0A6A1W9R4_9ROSI|nr:Transcription factor IIIB 90 kDa subunit [Morella rubra]
MVTAFNISGGDSIINPASSFYRIAVERNFTRGRRTEQVAAACLYIACRVAKDPKPFLLIDFSEFLGINVYVLGAVFLQLCQLISLGEHPTIVKPVDPSLYIPRFAEKLLKERNMKVCGTALHIIASMKRDWIQTGRKPSGLCGAALYISALSHGYRFSKSDIVGKIVRICEVTLTKRLIEFENTDSGSLTVEELNKNASELKECGPLKDRSQSSGEVLCEHKDSGAPHFAHGLCRNCYEDFIELSGGLHGGLEPPAFQRAERERLAMASANKGGESSVFLMSQEGTENIEQVEKVKSSDESGHKASKNEHLDQRENGSNSDTGDQIKEDGVSDAGRKSKDTSSVTDDESDHLSDIDDVEVSGYLNNEEEMRYKKIIWEEMNREYLEEQAAAAAAKMESQANFQNCSDELRAAQELAAAAAAAVAKSRKERKRKQDANANPAQTAAEAAHQMLIKKRLSSKINYDVLETLFAEKPPSDLDKKPKASNGDSDAKGQSDGEKEHDGDITDNYEELGQGFEDMEQEDVTGTYGSELHLENEEDVYGYEYDNGEDEY